MPPTRGHCWPRSGADSSEPTRGSYTRQIAVLPRHLKDYWNAQSPAKDSQFLQYYEAPELAVLENLLYGAPGGPTGHAGGALDEIDEPGRTDLSLILLKGVPGVNAIGSNPVAADMLRVNTAIAPCTSDPADDDVGSCRRLAVLDGDVAGFPNGRRLTDDVTDIELRAVAQGYGAFLNGAFGLPNKSPNNIVGDGVDTNADMPFLGSPVHRPAAQRVRVGPAARPRDAVAHRPLGGRRNPSTVSVLVVSRCASPARQVPTHR